MATSVEEVSPGVDTTGNYEWRSRTVEQGCIGKGRVRFEDSYLQVLISFVGTERMLGEGDGRRVDAGEEVHLGLDNGTCVAQPADDFVLTFVVAEDVSGDANVARADGQHAWHPCARIEQLLNSGIDDVVQQTIVHEQNRLVRRGFVQIQRDDEMLAVIVREVVEQDSQSDIPKVDVLHPVRLIAHNEQRTVVVSDERVIGNVPQDVLNGMHT